MRFLLAVLALAVGAYALVYAVYSGVLAIPDRWNPWAPLAIDQPPNWLTRFKLGRLPDDASACLVVLEQAPMRYERLPERRTAPGCELRNAVRVHASGMTVGEAFTLSCPAAVAFALWERHVVQPAAESHFGARVAHLEHFGAYACRNIYGRKEGPVSRHATGNALDVAGFVLADGRRVRVLTDWSGEDAKARFLREVRDGACRLFDGVLGPDYNPAHRDHLHLARGGFRACR